MANELAFEKLITTEYEIQQKIFKHLSVTDLVNCSSACQLWKTAVNATVKARRKIQFLMEYRRQTTVPFISSDADFAITFSKNLVKYGDFNWQYMTRKSKQLSCKFGLIASMPREIAPDKLSKSIQATFRFPPWDGAHIISFKLHESYTGPMDDGKIGHLPEDAEIKAALVISCLHPCRLLNYLHSRQATFPLAGCQRVDKESDEFIHCVLFYGPKVHARSCVLPPQMTDESQITKRVELFRATCKETENSALFTFTCIGRSATNTVDDVPAIEARVLDKFFPHCGRMGFLSNGEMGVDCPALPSVKRKRNEYEHSFSTTLLYIWYE